MYAPEKGERKKKKNLRVGPILIQFSDKIEIYFFHTRNVKIIMVNHKYVIRFFQAYK